MERTEYHMRLESYLNNNTRPAEVKRGAAAGSSSSASSPRGGSGAACTCPPVGDNDRCTCPRGISEDDIWEENERQRRTEKSPKVPPAFFRTLLQRMRFKRKKQQPDYEVIAVLTNQEAGHRDSNSTEDEEIIDLSRQQGWREAGGGGGGGWSGWQSADGISRGHSASSHPPQSYRLSPPSSATSESSRSRQAAVGSGSRERTPSGRRGLQQQAWNLLNGVRRNDDRDVSEKSSFLSTQSGGRKKGGDKTRRGSKDAKKTATAGEALALQPQGKEREFKRLQRQTEDLVGGFKYRRHFEAGQQQQPHQLDDEQVRLVLPLNSSSGSNNKPGSAGIFLPTENRRSDREVTTLPPSASSAHGKRGKAVGVSEEARRMLAVPPPQPLKATSMDMLNNHTEDMGIGVPENQLQYLTPHQARVQKSLEKLNLPAWYKPSANSPASARWRRGDEEVERSGWRRGSLSRPSTPGSTCSTPAPTSSYSRWSATRLNGLGGRDPSPATSNFSIKSLQGVTGGLSAYRQPYMGWRSQERITETTSQLVSNPSQRLASSLLNTQSRRDTARPPLPPSRDGSRVFLRSGSTPARHHPASVQEAAKSPNHALHDSIKQVTEAIVDYCADPTPRGINGGNSTSSSQLTPSTSDRLPLGGLAAPVANTSGGRSPARHVWIESSFVSGGGKADQLPTNFGHVDHEDSNDDIMDDMEEDEIIISETNYSDGQISDLEPLTMRLGQSLTMDQPRYNQPPEQTRYNQHSRGQYVAHVSNPRLVQ